jgi:predicted nucleic acid-binding protein
MNLVDSSGWLEYFSNSSNASFFEPAILDTSRLLVPTVSLYEVFKKVLIEQDEGIALKVVAQMKQGRILDLDESTALSAARISRHYKLPLADSLIYASAEVNGAVLWTQDEHFQGLPNVQFKAKKKA